jgi:hypothetical protein
MNNISYAIQINNEGTAINGTEADGTIWWIPEDSGNRHYQEYLSWLAEGNEPEVIE